eukprot:g19906.t1
MDQLAGVSTNIFNPSLLRSEIPTYFNKTNIILVPKKNHVASLNAYRSVALTSIIMKFLDRLVMAHINSSLPDYVDPLQFTYRCNRSMADAIFQALHSSLECLDKNDSYVSLLLIDYNFAFNNTIPNKLISKLWDLGHSSPLMLREWIFHFLTNKP